MIRLVAVADTHMFHDELVVPDGDVFIHAGDLCRAGDLEELAVAAAWIRSLPHRTKIVVAGNHDWAFHDSADEARRTLGDPIIYLQDEGIVAAGLTVWGSPWQPEYNGWAFNLPRGKALADVWAKIPERLDVLITHGPPQGIGDRSISGDERLGCRDLRERVRVARPKVHLFGHIHDDGGAWSQDGTTFVNCTTWECERAPTVIDLDGDTVAVSAPPARGRQTLRSPSV